MDAAMLFKDCEEMGISKKTADILHKEDINTMTDFCLTTMEDHVELRKAGVTLGQMNKLRSLVPGQTNTESNALPRE